MWQTSQTPLKISSLRQKTTTARPVRLRRRDYGETSREKRVTSLDIPKMSPLPSQSRERRSPRKNKHDRNTKGWTTGSRNSCWNKSSMCWTTQIPTSSTDRSTPTALSGGARFERGIPKVTCGGKPKRQHSTPTPSGRAQTLPSRSCR